MHLPLENYFVVVGHAPTPSAAGVAPAVTATEAICLAGMTNLGGHGDVAGRARRLTASGLALLAGRGGAV
jgi:hypothetical protein